jgi:hypothetical protein
LKQAVQQTVVVNTLTLAGIGSDSNAVNASLADVGLVAGSCTEVRSMKTFHLSELTSRTPCARKVYTAGSQAAYSKDHVEGFLCACCR